MHARPIIIAWITCIYGAKGSIQSKKSVQKNASILNEKRTELVSQAFRERSLITTEKNKLQTDAERKKTEKVISVYQLVKFTLPLLIIWLSSPIMSLVDTSVVGRRSLPQLAALGPGTSICDNISYIYTFFASVTTSLVATAIVESNFERISTSVCSGSFIAFVVGSLTTLLLHSFGKDLLMIYLKDSPGVDVILPHSLLYTKIRSLGYPAVNMSMVFQGACFAQKDAVTPLRVCAMTAITNLVLDMIFVFKFGWGIAGAAAATVMAQYLGAVALAYVTVRRLDWNIRLPKVKEIVEFIILGGPVLLAILFQCSTTFLVTIAAGTCSTVSLAAHQVIYGVLLLFCPIGEAISQMVQSYLPPLLHQSSANNRETFKMTTTAIPLMKIVLKVSSILGVVDGFLAWTIIWFFAGIFSSDLEVWEVMKSVSMYCAGALLLHSITMMLQGTMLAQRDAKSLAIMYCCLSAIFASLFISLRHKIDLTLIEVWRLFFMYQLLRFFAFSVRALSSNRNML